MCVLNNEGGLKSDMNNNNNRKNILVTIGIICLLLVLIVIVMVNGGQGNTNINENNDMNNVVQNENMSMEELVDKIEGQPGYEEDEKITASPTDLEDSETEYDEESSEDEISEEATIDPEKLPNPDFNNDDDEREPQNQSQGTNATFQPKKYMIDTNSKRELKVRLKGTPKAKVKGIYRYVDEKGELKTKEWDERLNKEGEDTVTIRISHKPDKVEFQILSIEHKDGSNIGDCIVDSYEVK